MAEPTDSRVAVYLDFDNIVISWYDRVHGRNAYAKDRQRISEQPGDPEVAERLSQAMIEVGAIIDYAASFGTLVLTRAYADWSSPVNAVYRSQLVARAVDLVQLFPAAAYAKNGADIRLAVDAVEDMFRLPDLTHVVIVAGDSDYVPLAQRCKRLGRYVIGVGVAGSTAKSLAAACDEFEAYDSLSGVVRPVKVPATVATPVVDAPVEAATAPAETATEAPKAKSRSRAKAKPAPAEAAPPKLDEQGEATQLLERALRLGHDKGDADEWLHSSAVKTHMRRMDPSFSEKALGYRSFSDFLKSRDDMAELEETGHERLVRLRDH
ncbi:NYN domain-containing protein [Microbacterium sp. SSW1-49]|uniref:NYN domain-containing protein n=1 Tax=Microbacterium croceum TaxID=2851645 RepID=A0ABT0FH97_9MICO|nr:NYN domain-containing protein [Microbacterium croceum]MCK2037434.1 NYN domain-containing protein [Microbacterium croceum]